jgi:hypothetical protein
MSTLNVSSLKGLTSSTTNIALNTDGTTTLAVFAGSGAPPITTTGALWLDTTTPSAPVLKVYNASSTSWSVPPGGSVPPSPFPPASPVTGDIYYDTSTLPGVLKVYNGSDFVPVATTPGGTSAPTNPQSGTTWYDTTSTPPVLKVWNGSNWVPASSPPGGTSAPTNPQSGTTWYDSTSTPPVLKVWNGSNWVPASSTPGGSAAPTNPQTGTTWYDTGATPPVLNVWNGTAWVPSGNAPAGTTAPTSPSNGTTWYDTNVTPPIFKVWNSVTSTWNPIPATASGAAPTTPTNGQLWSDTSVTPPVLKVWNSAGSAWVAAGGGGSGSVTSITAGAGLTGGTITTTGTIALDTTAVIAPTLLSATGDMVYASAANTPARLAIGTAGQVLTVTGGVPTWTSLAPGGVTSVTGTAPIASSGGATPAISLTPGTARQLLQTNAGATGVEFASNIDIPGTLDVTGAAVFDNTVTVAGTHLQLNAQGDLRFADSDSSNYVAFQAPATVASNVTWTLPGVDGTSGQVLSTDGSGTLSWATAGGGGWTRTSTVLAPTTAGDQVQVSAGTAAAPGLAFVGDPNTGFYNAGANLLGISTNGVGNVFVDPSGKLLVGTSTARSLYSNTIATALQVEGTSFASSSASIVANGATGVDNPRALFVLGRTRGAIGSNTVVASGDVIGDLAFQAADGSQMLTAAQIRAEVDGTPGLNDMPGRLVFSTTPSGSAAPVEVMRITSDKYMRMAAGTGGIQFNGDTAAANALDDYEQGTFTATVGIGTTTGLSGSGRYTVIGNTTVYQIFVSLPNTSFSVNDSITITGWPFALPTSSGPGLLTAWNSGAGGAATAQGMIQRANTTTVQGFITRVGAAVNGIFISYVQN